MKQVVIYIRMSKKNDGRLGIDVQREYCQIAAKDNNWTITGEFIDDGLSGGLPVDERPALKAAIKLCNATGASLLVAKVDRLARNAEVVMSLCNRFPERILIATMPCADTLQIGIYALLAEQELKFIKQRTKDALSRLQSRADNGNEEAIQKVARRNQTIQKAHADGINRINAAKVVQARIERFIGGIEDNILAAQAKGCNTLRDIAQYLNDKAITTSRGKQWTACSVQRVMNRI